jgi:hypothetical protein
MKLRFASALALVSVLAFAPSACSPATKGSTANADGGSGGQAQGGSGAGASQSQGGSDLGIGGGDTGGTSFQECAKATEAASTLPLNMYVAIDKSGSMADNDKWGKAKAAFVDFFQNPDNQASKISVALRFWPDGGCNDVSCDVNACATPQVDLGELSNPTQVQALTQLYNSKSPGGNTPMFAALGGAAKWGVEHAQAGEGATATVIVFVTDGQPHGCDENIADIAKNASDAYDAAKVSTFAVGLAGSNEGDMQAIATAGHSTKPFLIGNGDAQAELAAALKEIQKTTLACVFAMPEAQGSDPIDPQQVNLSYTPANATPIAIGQVTDPSQCDAAGGWGWYYDDPANPHVIQLCPALCDNVQKYEGGKIEVILGCETKPA